MNDIEKKLEKELTRGIEDMGKLEVGTDTYSRAADDISKLYRVRADEVQKSIEYWDRIEVREKQDKEQKLDRYIGYGLQGVSILAPLVVYVSLFKDGLRFEKDGVVGSQFFRNLMGKMKL